ncbi:NAD(P)-binding domain-containing protein [Candidatus Saccharibacteria bacterium]|jgi:predicted dinucleotide-binding enzyme|nr:MAG: NAD(P)-binding domain-containing protein [Candidatus Saccharibacteria bacterium]
MKIAILGTGMVGKAHAGRLVALGHEVALGTQDVEATKKSDKPDNAGQLFADWLAKNQSVQLMPFHEAAEFGDIIINALSGEVSVLVLTGLNQQIGKKIVIDIANPLDFSHGFPPTLSVSNTDSLGEQLQAAIPKARVVKAFNTLTAALQVEPSLIASGEHALFISGNDAVAKQQVTELAESYGWHTIIDLGDISTARGSEMYLPLWLRLMDALGTPMFNIAIIK